MNMGEFQEIADSLSAAKHGRLKFPEPWRMSNGNGVGAPKIVDGETVIARVRIRPGAFRDAVTMAAAPTMKAMLHKFLETGLDSDGLTALAEAVDNFLKDLETRT